VTIFSEMSHNPHYAVNHAAGGLELGGGGGG
jgi:hypothetical protein